MAQHIKKALTAMPANLIPHGRVNKTGDCLKRKTHGFVFLQPCPPPVYCHVYPNDHGQNSCWNLGHREENVFSLRRLPLKIMRTSEAGKHISHHEGRTPMGSGAECWDLNVKCLLPHS